MNEEIFRRILGGTQRETIHEECIDYMDNVLSEDSPPVQRSEVRLAFWAGAVTCYRLVMSVQHLSDEEGEKRLTEMDQAFREFKP